MPPAGPRATAAARSATPRRYAAGLAVAVSVLVAAGCGQPEPSDDGAAPTVSVPIQPTILPATTETDAPDPSAPADGGLYDASDSLVASTCSPDAKGVWSFTGEVRNADSVEHTFTVAVFLTTPTDADPVVTKEMAVTVAGGRSAPVEAKAFATHDPKDVECLTGVTVKEE